jgi:hypothetical protein
MSQPPKCPRCKLPCQRLENLIPGHVVFACRADRAFRLEKSSQWLIGVGYALARLAELAAEADRDDKVFDEMWESPSDDPRWVTFIVE